MSINIDRSLDEIIAEEPRASRRGGRGGPRRRGSAKAAAVGSGARASAVKASARGNRAQQAQQQQQPIVIPGRAPGGANEGSKIIVSNLPGDVTEAQIKELFSSTIGPLKKVQLSYLANGRSTGVCHVIFQRAADGARAYQQYNNRLIDQKRPIKVEIVVNPATAAATQPALVVQQKPAARGGAAGRGRGRGRRGGSRAPPRPKKTVEDLDAEMDDYTAHANGAAAPAPAA